MLNALQSRADTDAETEQHSPVMETDLQESPALVQRPSTLQPHTFSLSQNLAPLGEVVAFPTADTRTHVDETPSDSMSEASQTPSPAPVTQVSTSVPDDESLPLYARNATHIPAGWLFKGDMDVGNNIALDCHVVGHIQVADEHSCVLNSSSNVEGSLRASKLDMHGTFSGDVDSSGGKVTIHPTSRVKGEVRYTDIGIFGGVHQMNIVYSPRA